MYLIGEYLIEKKGGYWFLQTDKESDFFLAYVVGDFDNEKPEIIVDPGEVAAYLVDKKPPRSIMDALKKLNLLEKS